VKNFIRLTYTNHVGGVGVAKNSKREVMIIDRNVPRVAIQITEVSYDRKAKNRRRQSVSHLTVTNLSGAEAKRLIVRAIEKAGGR
jgi:hypothetical protein